MPGVIPNESHTELVWGRFGDAGSITPDLVSATAWPGAGGHSYVAEIHGDSTAWSRRWLPLLGGGIDVYTYPRTKIWKLYDQQDGIYELGKAAYSPSQLQNRFCFLKFETEVWYLTTVDVRMLLTSGEYYKWITKQKEKEA